MLCEFIGRIFHLRYFIIRVTQINISRKLGETAT